jgi:hypothetical protein
VLSLYNSSLVVFQTQDCLYFPANPYFSLRSLAGIPLAKAMGSLDQYRWVFDTNAFLSFFAISLSQ